MPVDPISVGFAVGGAILGKIGMNRKRREEQERRKKEREHAVKTQGALLGAVGDIRAEYRERAGFAREQYGLGREAGLLGYQQDRQAMDTAIGGTNLAYGGGAMAQSRMMDESFALDSDSRNLGYKSDYWGLEKQYEGELRDVKMGLLNLEATAAQRGYQIPGVGTGFNINQQGNLGGSL